METFHRILIGFHRFTSLHPFVGLQMILPIYIHISSNEYDNFLRKHEKRFLCIKSYMIHH